MTRHIALLTTLTVISTSQVSAQTARADSLQKMAEDHPIV